MGLPVWMERLRRRRRPLRDAGDTERDPAVQRVLLTGAAGGVAAQLLPLITPLAPHWRLVDARPDGLHGFSDVRVRSIGPGTEADDLFSGVDAVVHLAGQAKPAPVDVLQAQNVETTRWLLAQMQAAGIRRLVYASSMHVMGRYPRVERVTPALEPRPSDAYGASKVAAERLIAAAAQEWDLRALVLRMGHVMPTAAAAEPGNWLATDDLARLVAIGLHHRPVGVATVHAVTPHRGDDMGQRAFSAASGMRWRNDAPSYRAAMQRVAEWYGDDATARLLRGGVFASGRA